MLISVVDDNSPGSGMGSSKSFNQSAFRIRPIRFITHDAECLDTALSHGILAIYQKPLRCLILLHCGETFCLICLGEIDSHTSKGALPCPSCRQVIKVPHSGVAKLVDNSAIFGLVTRRQEESEVGIYCEKHADEKLKFFCNS
uniref:RING-type domain-containing protein n=1 Tax=Oncorhynchus kisutch TaxID=8019 RepID=A0A8C7JX45_ONCKI